MIIAVFGTIGGLALGTFLGWGLMRAIEASEGIGSFVVPVATLAVVLGAAIVAGIVAALRPARRAAKLDVPGTRSPPAEARQSVGGRHDVQLA